MPGDLLTALSSSLLCVGGWGGGLSSCVPGRSHLWGGGGSPLLPMLLPQVCLCHMLCNFGELKPLCGQHFNICTSATC